LEKKQPIEAVILDLGGVVFGISIGSIIDAWAESAGVHPQDIAPKFRADLYYERFETAEVSPAQYRDHVRDTLGIRISDEDFDQGWNSIYLEVLPGIETLLKQLQKTVRLLALTNTNQIHAPKWRARYSDVLMYFEKVFASHEIGARKPDPESFRIVLDYVNIEPGKAVFVDDYPENVRGAEALGMKGIIADNPAKTVQKIRQLVVGTMK
jgi:putative hydrolase of the HAD superfamily